RYIMGNPPFIGARIMDSQQKGDLERVASDVKGIASLDYVTGWYFKAATFIRNTKIQCSFVSTNSIIQGQQVELLWKPLLENYNIHINFAYQTFIWDSEATDKAHVHVVIIGFSV